MLVRAYRLTDKVGVAILKSGVALTDTTMAGVSIVAKAGRGGLSSVFGTLFMLILGIGRLIFAVLRRIARVFLIIFGFIAAIFGRFLTLFTGAAQRSSSRAVRSAGSSAADIMARRAARAEMEVGLAEDPLRIQNRTLSLFFIGLLVVLIAVVLWATNPARTGTEVDGNNSGGIGFLASGSTPVATTPPILSTLVPTATTLPSVLEARGSIAYVVRENGQDDIWAVNIGTRTPIRIVASPADDRDPAWSPDGTRLAYASRQDGNWQLYVLNVQTNTTSRMTYNLAFHAAPQWSPDGQWLVYENYQDNNLDIYVVPVDGSQPPQRVTENAAPDFSPSWSPDGRRIAFVSWRDGNQDIYIFSLDNPTDTASINLTNTATRQEDYPTWSPDGKEIAYSAVDGGIEKVFVKSADNPQADAQVIERGRAPAWAPNGSSLVYAVDSLEGTQLVAGPAPSSTTGVSTLAIGTSQRASDPTWTGVPLPPALVSTGGLPAGVSQALFVEQVANPDSNGLYRLGTLENVQVARSQAYLSDKVNDSYDALRRRILNAAGWDFLGQIDDAFWGLDHLPDAGEERRNWYMTGRAFGITRNLIAGFPAQLELVREDLDVNTYWHVYIRTAEEAQNGELGEPLRRMPWDMLSRNGDVQAYDQGGRLKSAVPAGYYVDLTQLAEDYGWDRVAAGSDWRANVNNINYWLFEKRGGLDWYSAMRELYTDAQLGGFAPTATPAQP